MKIRINGEVKDIEGGMTLEELLFALDIKRQGMAVEVNRVIVPKGLYGETVLNEGDAVEIVRMVGGG